MRGGLLSLVVLAATPARAATLWVAFPARGDSCTYDQVAAALRARLGDVDVRPGLHDVSSGEVQVRLERAGDDWSLRVRAAGENDLERKLPRPGLDCVALSETAALMVDRYLDDIRWAGAGPAVVQKVPPPPPAPGWQLVLQVGGSGEQGVLPQVGPGITLDVGARKGRWQIEASGAMGLGPGQAALVCANSICSQPGQNGTLAMQAGTVQVAAGYGLPLGFGDVRFELAPGAELFSVAVTRSSSSSQIFQLAPGITPLPFVGARVGYEAPVWRRLYLAFRIEARAHLGEAQFQVENYTTVFTRLFDGDASLALGYLFF